MLRCSEDRKKFGRFFLQTLHSSLCDDACIDQELQPEQGFVDLFHYDAYLGNKLGLRSRTAHSAIVCCNGRP